MFDRLQDAGVLAFKELAFVRGSALADEQTVKLFAYDQVQRASRGAQEDKNCGFLRVISEHSCHFDGENAAFAVAEDADMGGIDLRLLAQEAVSGGGVATEIFP